MANKVLYVCSSCGATSPQWLGHCPKCGQWNTYAEAPAAAASPAVRAAAAAAAGTSSAQRLADADDRMAEPFSCGLPALDRLLGGGLVPGAVLLLGGEPGIGKSTLLLQVSGHVAAPGRKVLYVSGEETLAQVKGRAERLNVLHDGILALATTSVDDLLATLHAERPSLLVLDSVQTVACSDVDGLPGNVNQVRAVATRVIETCRALGVCALLIGHVTKEGSLAGPRLLEHMVDTVLSLEGDRRQACRLMRVFKNRFGSSEEMLVFSMGQKGLDIVDDPSTFFLEDRNPDLSGTAVVMTCEGRRPLAVEVQALCSRSFLNIPRRAALGFDTNRLNLLLAVLEKRLHLNFSQADVYAKVGGGLRLDDPGLDLGLVCALLSSWYDVPLPPRAVFFGELDLNGQIRPVAGQDQRERQARRLSFEPVVGPGFAPSIVELCARLFPGSGRKRRAAPSEPPEPAFNHASNHAKGHSQDPRPTHGQTPSRAPGREGRRDTGRDAGRESDSDARQGPNQARNPFVKPF